MNLHESSSEGRPGNSWGFLGIPGKSCGYLREVTLSQLLENTYHGSGKPKIDDGTVNYKCAGLCEALANLANNCCNWGQVCTPRWYRANSLIY